MSLINDALKRANQSQNQPARPRPPLSPMQPVESTRRPTAWLALLVPGLLVLVLAMAGWFLYAWWQSRPGQKPAVAAAISVPVPSVSPTIKPPAAVPAPVAPPVTPAPPIATVATIKVSTNLVVRGNPLAQPVKLTATDLDKPLPVDPPVVDTTPLPAPPPVPEIKPATIPPPLTPNTNAIVVVPEKPAAKPEFPEMRLQGIFFRVNKPSVLINSRTLFINDKVDGVRVIAIDRQSVTLEFSGERKILTLD